jgi:long-chain acyl-CoA synthetase
VALVTLDEESIRKWARQVGLGELSLAELSRRPEVHALVQRAIADLNSTLPRFATVKRFAILERDFSEQAGELTPSQKVKRKVVEHRFRDLLDSLYPRTESSSGS